MIRSILVPLDQSRLSAQALPFAQAVLAAEGTIQFLHVIPVGEDYLPEVVVDEFGWGTDETLTKAGTAHADFDRLLEEWRAAGTLVAPASLCVEIGDRPSSSSTSLLIGTRI